MAYESTIVATLQASLKKAAERLILRRSTAGRHPHDPRRRGVSLEGGAPSPPYRMGNLELRNTGRKRMHREGREGNVEGGGERSTLEGGAPSPPYRTSPPHGFPDADATARIPPMLAVRKRPAHMPLVVPVDRAVIVFLTVCTKDRKPILAAPEAHASLVRAWAEARRWHVGRYVVMPDHVHLFCAPASDPPEPLKIWARYWKARVSSVWPHQDEQPVWQPDFWDTQLRREQGYAAKWDYVRRNPVRAGLAVSAEEWPFQGELHALRWYDDA